MNAIIQTINADGQLIDFQKPLVMEIVNASPDSFFTHGIKNELTGDIIDIGGCSTRPNSEVVSEEEELARIKETLKVIRARYPEAILSVDTFRPKIAEYCIKEFGVQIINDVSGENPNMYKLVSSMNVPYVLTFNDNTCIEHQSKDIIEIAMEYFANRIQRLRDLGQNDIILDPGFGFGKTIEQNYQLLNRMEELQIFELPLLVGISHKSMIYKVLNCTPDEAYNGTTVINTIGLMKGANILRVHDVDIARECIELTSKMLNSTCSKQ